MVKKIVLNENSPCYLQNKTTKKPVKKFGLLPFKEMEIVININNERVVIDGGSIQQLYGDQYIANIGDHRFIFDDTYQNILTKAGYIVYQNYDKQREYDKEAGTVMRRKIFEKLQATSVVQNSKMVKENSSSLVVITEKDNYEYTLLLCTVNTIVNKNHQRKDNFLPFYPYSKDMDKYGTIYLGIFAKRKDNGVNIDNTERFIGADSFEQQILSEIGPDEFHYVNLQIKNRQILFCDDM